METVRLKFAKSDFFKNCLYGICTELDIETCKKTCHCIIFEDKCIPKRIKNADLINRDPDKYAKSLTTKELEKLVYRYLYK